MAVLFPTKALAAAIGTPPDTKFYAWTRVSLATEWGISMSLVLQQQRALVPCHPAPCPLSADGEKKLFFLDVLRDWSSDLGPPLVYGAALMTKLTVAHDESRNLAVRARVGVCGRVWACASEWADSAPCTCDLRHDKGHWPREKVTRRFSCT